MSETDTPGLRPNRACRNCINIKAKCVPRDGINEDGLTVCQRCHRLNKSCTTPPAAPKKVPRVQKGVRVRQLEQRINELTSLVTSRSNEAQPEIRKPAQQIEIPFGSRSNQTQHSIIQSSKHAEIPFASTPISDILTTCRRSKCTADGHPGQSMLSAVCIPAAMEGNNSAHIALESIPTPPTSVEGHSGPSEPTPKGSSFPLGHLPYDPPLRQDISRTMLSTYTQQEMESLLKQFRETMLPYFPFVIIPEHFTVAYMTAHRPFLLTVCIAMASHRDIVTCRAIIRDVMKYLAHQMLIMGEKSFDLVQGLLIFIAWHQFNTEGNPQLMNLVHLCQSLLTDLGLNRSPGQGLYSIKMGKFDTIHGTLHNSDVVRTLEEKRAYLGFYYIHAKLASAFKRIEFLRWTDYLENCCQTLYNSPEYASDRKVVGHVRMFQIVEKYSAPGGIKPSKSLPLRAYTQLFTHDLHELQKDTSLFAANDTSWEAHNLGVELILYENTIAATECEPAHRVEALYHIFALIQRAFDTFLTCPYDDWSLITFIRWTYIVNFLDVLSKLCFTVVPGWDLNFVRSTYGFSNVIDRLIARLHEANAYEEAKDATKPFTRFLLYAAKLERSKKWYDERIAQEADLAAEPMQFNANGDANNNANGSAGLINVMDTSNMALDAWFPFNSIRDTFDWDIDFGVLPNGVGEGIVT